MGVEQDSRVRHQHKREAQEGSMIGWHEIEFETVAQEGGTRWILEMIVQDGSLRQQQKTTAHNEILD